MPKKGLGRGLESLIPQKSKTSSIVKAGEVTEVPVSRIKANPHQPRQNIDKIPLKELSLSIREHGVIQPLVVSEAGDGSYQLLAGERRLQASKMAGLQKVPVVVRSATEQQKLEVALVENVQREDLNSLEEARAYQQLIDDFNLTQDQVAKKVGKSRANVANILRILTLSAEIKEAISAGKITLGHAKVLLGVKDKATRKKMFQDILAGQLSVRDTEQGAKGVKIKVASGQVDRNKKADIIQLEGELRQALGTKIEIKERKGKGKIAIDFYSKGELQELVDRIIR